MLTKVLANAWLFPGQGSQYPQMGRHIWSEKLASDVLSMAESISRLPLRHVMENGPEETLRSPEYLEPSIIAFQVAYVLLLQGQGMQPDAVAGYSLGEIGALYCAGCLSLLDALTVASHRGRILARHADKGEWASLSIRFQNELHTLPLDGTGNIFIAAYNSPRELTVTGQAVHVRALEKVLLRSGVSVSPVAIDGPWHSVLATDAARETAELLSSIELQPPIMPVCLGTRGKFETQLDAIRLSLGKQIESSVYWSTALQTLWLAGVRSTLEIGPGRVLTSFMRSNWGDRTYQSNFIERQGGRPANYDAIRASSVNKEVSKEKHWTQSA